MVVLWIAVCFSWSWGNFAGKGAGEKNWWMQMRSCTGMVGFHTAYVKSSLICTHIWAKSLAHMKGVAVWCQWFHDSMPKWLGYQDSSKDPAAWFFFFCAGYCVLHFMYFRQYVSYLLSCLYFKQSYLRATMRTCFLKYLSWYVSQFLVLAHQTQ